MKKLIYLFTGVITVLFFTNLSFAAPSTTEKLPSKNAQHTMGNQFEAYHYSWIGKIDHTYPVASTNNGQRRAWHALGGDTGGQVLADTTTKCGKNCIDISTINFIETKSPCMWPAFPYYAVVGVCWNSVNRSLYYTGKTVHNIAFYPVVEDYFGTYGLDDNSTCVTPLCMEGRKKYSWSGCKLAQQAKFPWQGNSLKLLTAKQGVDPRITLYNKYYAKNKEESLQGIAPQELRQQYLAALMDLNINESLGAKFPADKRASLQNIRLNLQDTLKSLKTSPATHADYLNEFNLAVNQSLKQYRALLTDKQYEQFMHVPKSKVFDVRQR